MRSRNNRPKFQKCLGGGEGIRGKSVFFFHDFAAMSYDKEGKLRGKMIRQNEGSLSFA